MNLGIRRMIAFAAATVLLAAGLWWSTGGRSRASADSSTTVSALPLATAAAITSALPGATSSLLGDPDGSQVLSIALPSAISIPPIFGSDGTLVSSNLGEAATAELGWRADMAAAYVAAQVPSIVRFQASGSGLTIAEDESDWLHAPLRSEVDGAVGGGASSTLDQLSTATAVAQMNSNIAAVKAAYGSRVPMTTSVTVIPVNLTQNAYGLEVSIRVDALSTLAAHLTDIVLGLQTGLTGNTSAAIEGVGIDITDASSHQAGAWIDARDGSGGNVSTATLNLLNLSSIDTSFPNLTGGPSPQTEIGFS